MDPFAKIKRTQLSTGLKEEEASDVIRFGPMWRGLHLLKQEQGIPGPTVAGVARDEDVPSDRIPQRHIVEHLAGILPVSANGVELDQRSEQKAIGLVPVA